jgi:hypothetical protein
LTHALVRPRGHRAPARRRKLRQAQTDGIRIQLITSKDMTADVTRVVKAWAKSQGGEPGFFMGRFAFPHL